MRDVRRVPRAPLAAAAVMLLLTACGDEAAVEVQRLNAEAIDDAGAAAADEAGAEAGAETDADEGAGGAADGEAFAQLIASERSVGITYRVEGDAAGPDEITLVRDGDDVAIVGIEDGREMRLVHTDDDSFASCARHGEEWKCVELGGLGDLAEVMVAGAAAPFLLEGPGVISSEDWSDYETATILGRPARCVSPEQTLEHVTKEFAAPTEVCADEETGALLRVASPDGGSGRLEAVEFGEPDRALLALPAEPLTLDVLGGLEGLLGDDVDLDFEDLDLEDFGIEGHDPDVSDT